MNRVDYDYDDHFLIDHPGGTVFDIHTRDLLVDYYSAGDARIAESEIQNRAICNRLEGAGGGITRPVMKLEQVHPRFWCHHFNFEIQELVMFPAMIDCKI